MHESETSVISNLVACQKQVAKKAFHPPWKLHLCDALREKCPLRQQKKRLFIMLYESVITFLYLPHVKNIRNHVEEFMRKEQCWEFFQELHLALERELYYEFYK